MWVGSPVLMCSYTVARGSGPAYAKKEKKMAKMVLSGLPKVCYYRPKNQQCKDYK